MRPISRTLSLAATVVTLGALIACHSERDQRLPSIAVRATTPTSTTPTAWGYDTATAMTTRYADTTGRCPASGPVFRCSGILFRATTNPAGTHAWDPSPQAIASGGISFSFLRKDASFRSLAPAYNHGFVFYAYDHAPAGRTLPRALCAFPLDSGTTGRAQAGCGRQTGFSVPAPARSEPCQSQNITTSAEWVAHFNGLGGSGDVKRHGQCGFSLDSDATGAFNAAIAAMGSIGSWLNTLTNEMRLATWQNGIGAQLPIESFFYTTASGRLTAQLDQKDYENTTGLKRPIIKFTLPTTTAPASFEYLPSDQAIAPPTDTNPPIGSLKPIVVQASGPGGTLLKLSDFRHLDEITARAPRYDGMSSSDLVNMKWAGTVDYKSPWVTAGGIHDMDFEIPRVEVVDAIGSKVTLTFARKVGSTVTISAPLVLTVEAQPIDLPAPRFNATTRQVTVTYPALASGDKITVRLTGIQKRDTAQQTASGSSALVFDIPSTWIAENKGHAYVINYSVVVKAGGDRLFSHYVRMPP